MKGGKNLSKTPERRWGAYPLLALEGKKMKKYYYEIRPILTEEVEAENEKEAFEKLRESFQEFPHEIDDIADFECKLIEVEEEPF